MGIFASDKTIPNNSIIIGDSNNQLGTIYCISGSNDSNIGQWTAPDGIVVTGTSSGVFTTVYGGGGNDSVSPYVGLQVKSGYSLTESAEGLYTCTIADENGILQSLHIGIRRQSTQSMLIKELTFLQLLHAYLVYIVQLA